EEKGLNVNFTKCNGHEATVIETNKQLSEEHCPDFTIAIYEGTDSSGHSYGFSFNNPAYKAGFERCEKFAYSTLKAIEGRDSYETEDWLIIITSDHGGIGTNHGGASLQERMIFIVTNK
ncbi:MAG: alkaline phosphatase family protein, partial [Clostridia bacterium]|nr:alkaline phosphatase family protein [Clostridia bacterium]